MSAKSAKALHTAPPIPELIAGSGQPFGIGSTLGDLPLYTFTITADCAICGLMERFTQFPDLPGAIISEAGRISLLSRHQFLECLLHLGQTSLFTNGPVRLILNQATHKALIMPGHTPILSGAQQALKRPLDQQSEPILVMRSHSLRAGESTHYYQLLDPHILNVAHWQIRGIETQIRYEQLQMQLLQGEKMAALGRLVDGVAHEILDPVGFIGGNLGYIATYAQQQSDLLQAYERAFPHPPSDISDLQTEIEIDYLRSDLPAAIKSAQGGAHRLKQLAASLQNFCHIDEVHPRPTDLNTLLESTLRLLKSRLTTQINIERCYGKLPPVPCYSGQLSQVFMNIFTNAIDSLLAQAQQATYAEGYMASQPLSPSAKLPQITVTTCVLAAQDTPTANPNEARWVSIVISDNGPGLLPETKAQIIDSFSTANRSRRETGLAMSYQIITAKHGGRLWVRSLHASENDPTSTVISPTGTEFEILLPLTTAA
ncbi:MAG: ATP-binding protein [Phormidesmis sp.]